jgi:transcriptional regulator GlxA family with amidase domain
MDSRIQKAFVLMETNLDRALSLGEVASSVNLSVSHLRLLFKAATGMSPAQYFKVLKMKEAKSLLETTFLNIKQIAARIGSKDMSHFMRDFKKAYGMAPKQYREWYHDASRLADQRAHKRIGQQTRVLANK